MTAQHPSYLTAPHAASVGREPRLSSLALHTVAFVVQAVLTVAVLSVLGVALMVAIGPIELLSFIAFPLLSVFVAVITLVSVVIVGLPLRLVPPLRNWWTAHGEVTLTGFAVGSLTIVGSYLWGGSTQPFVDPESGGIVEFFVPHGWTLLAGWLILAFSLAHIWWPRRLTWAIRRGVNTFGRLRPQQN